jgi:lipid-A-disaccharide synthase
MRIGIVANEPSGDQLAAGVIRALHEARPDIRFIGVAGAAHGRGGLRDSARSGTPLRHGAGRGSQTPARGPAPAAPTRATIFWPSARIFSSAWTPRISTLPWSDACAGRVSPPPTWSAPRSGPGGPGRVKGLRSAADLVLSIFPFEEDFLRERGRVRALHRPPPGGRDPPRNRPRRGPPGPGSARRSGPGNRPPAGQSRQ